MEIATLLSDFLIAEHPLQAAEALTKQPTDVAVNLLDEVSSRVAATLLCALPPTRAVEYLRRMADPRSVIEVMSTDDAARIVRSTDRQTAQRLLDNVKPSLARAIRGKILVADDTVGALAEHVGILRQETTVQDARDQVSSASVPYIYVVDHDMHLLGVVKTPTLWQQEHNQTLGSIMKHDVICLNQQTPVQAALRHPAWADYDTLPVVSGRNECIGVVRHKVLRQSVVSRSHRMQIHSAVSTALDLAELYWTSGAALLLGSSLGTKGHTTRASGDSHG